MEYRSPSPHTARIEPVGMGVLAFIDVDSNSHGFVRVYCKCLG
jgi:hypothetical protein